MFQTTKNNIIAYLIHSQDHVKNLIHPYRKQKKDLLKLEDRVFHKDVEDQFKDLVKWIIIRDIVSNAQVTTEDALLIVEEMNIEEYLNFT